MAVLFVIAINWKFFFHLLFNHEWINKLWYDPYNRLLLGNKKESTIGIYCNMDDSQDNNAEYEESDKIRIV